MRQYCVLLSKNINIILKPYMMQTTYPINDNLWRQIQSFEARYLSFGIWAPYIWSISSRMHFSLWNCRGLSSFLVHSEPCGDLIFKQFPPGIFSFIRSWVLGTFWIKKMEKGCPKKCPKCQIFWQNIYFCSKLKISEFSLPFISP
jgi:hypothetical protein